MPERPQPRCCHSQDQAGARCWIVVRLRIICFGVIRVREESRPHEACGSARTTHSNKLFFFSIKYIISFRIHNLRGWGFIERLAICYYVNMDHRICSLGRECLHSPNSANTSLSWTSCRTKDHLRTIAYAKLLDLSKGSYPLFFVCHAHPHRRRSKRIQTLITL